MWPRRKLPSLPPTLDTRAKGRIAETAAVRWLRRQGFEIRETNFAIKAGEIDVIAIEPGDPGDEPTLCFIEVKARRTAKFGPAVEAVTLRKQQRITKAAAAYLIRSEWTGPSRFDVLGLDQGERGWKFTLLRSAFEVS